MPPNTHPDRVYRFGQFRLVADERILLRDDVRVPMSPRVFDLLVVLVENAGRLVSKETLMSRVWGDSFVEEGNLNQTVSRLRRVLGEAPNENRFIETVPRIGYRFIANVELVEGHAGHVIKKTEPTPEHADVVISETEQAPTGPEGRSFKWLFIPVMLGLIVIAGFSALYLGRKTNVTVTSKPTKQTPIRMTDNPTREERPTFARDGSIRFTRWEGGVPMSFVMDADGTNARRDTSIPGLRTGAWSPDGRKVVFYKEGDNTTVYLADIDGSNEVKLPFVPGNLEWSPDGASIAYQAGTPDSDLFLYTLATGKTTDLVRSPGFESDPAFSPDGKSVVFVGDREGNPEIYVQALDGSGLKRLTNHPAHDEFPTFSPDGTQIVFNSNREEENYDVYIMNADGTGVRRLTTWASGEEIRPGCWSPDGTRILLTSDKEGTSNVYKIDVEPFEPRQILSDASRDLHFPSLSPDGAILLHVSSAQDKSSELLTINLQTQRKTVLLQSVTNELFPRFSPDGARVVFQDRLGGNAEICVIGSQGGVIQNLTNNPARDVNPSWSPDGTRIAFTSNRDGNYDVFPVYIMNADGSAQHRIYYSYSISAQPSWSPDGSQIVFANDKEDNRSGNFELFLIEPETVNPERRLTFRGRYDTEPVFSPDGKRIVFGSNTDGNWEIYVVNIDGTGLIRVTRDLGIDANPSWSPDGTKIIFSSNRGGRFAIYETVID